MQLLKNTACWCVFLFLIPASFLAWKENISLRSTFNNYASYYSKELRIANSERIKLRESDVKFQGRLTDLKLTISKTVPYSYLQDISVKVVVNSGSGSGVLFCREVAGEYRTFVWTAGHVASSLKRNDGTFRNATIKYERRHLGWLIGELKQEAKVIAYSNQYTGEDLALLEIIGNNHRWSSADFANDDIQQVGTEVIHVGSAAGFHNSVSLGVVSQIDREYRGKSYDQTSTMAYPGSSGGGVYMTNGKCIGLVTLGVGPGLNFYVPVRRMRAWAKKEGIEWAMDPSVPVPLSRTPTELEMTPKEAEIIISLPPPPVLESDAPQGAL